MGKIAGDRDLLVWQKAMDLVVNIYRLSDQFPRTELYGLRAQLLRAELSIPANIAEGRGRRSMRSFLHFLDISYGSLMESETFLTLAVRLGYVQESAVADLLTQAAEIGRILNGLMKSLENCAHDSRHNPEP